MSSNPCKDCKDRSAECHAKCKLYLAWSSQTRKENTEKWLEKQKKTEYNLTKRYAVERTMRKYGRKP